MDLNQVKTELTGLAEGSLEDITQPQFLRLLTRALDNRYEEIVNMCDTYNPEITLVAVGGETELDLPADFYTREDRNLWALYETDKFLSILAGENYIFWQKGKKLRFNYNLAAGEKIHLKYCKTPSRYSAMSVDGVGVEFIEEEALEIILSETQALYYGAIDENEPNASYVNSLTQANRNAL